MSIALSKAALVVLVVAAIGVISLVIRAYYANEIRHGFWKRLGYGLLLLAIASPAVISDWSPQWQSVRSAQHQHIYLLGLSFGFFAAVAVLLIEPAWKLKRVGILSYLALAMAAFLTLVASTRIVASMSEIIFSAATFSSAIFLFGLSFLIWRVASAKEDLLSA